MPLNAADRQILALLREVIEETDPVPPSLVHAAKASFTWRTVDAELAELTTDSYTAGAALRSRQPPRMLTFTAGPATLLIEVTAERSTRRLLGQLVGRLPTSVEIRHAHGVITAEPDEYGRFSATDIPPGMMSVACLVDDGEDFVTHWIEV
jgi:hypothetical protein